MISKKEKEEIKLHLTDILDECKNGEKGTGQIEHNVFEIAEHLGIKLDEGELEEEEKTLYEATFGNPKKSESAFFYAENDEQAEDFSILLEDEIGRKLMRVEPSEIKVNPTHDFELLKEKWLEIKLIGEV